MDADNEPNLSKLLEGMSEISNYRGVNHIEMGGTSELFTEPDETFT